MKQDALEHPKTLELADKLGVELPTAVGYLEFLWAFVGKLTPTGAVGKYSNAVIADKARWRGKPAVFVQALIDTGFLDEDTEHRLLVHDWSEHCPNWVRAKLKKAGLNFALKSGAKMPSLEHYKDGSKEHPQEPSLEPSSRAQILPSLAKPSLGKPSVTGAREDPEAFDADWIEATYPPTVHGRNSVDAVHKCYGLVNTGKATWIDLRRRLQNFRAYVQGGGYTDSSKVPSMRSWFDANGEGYWSREWTVEKFGASEESAMDRIVRLNKAGANG